MTLIDVCPSSFETLSGDAPFKMVEGVAESMRMPAVDRWYRGGEQLVEQAVPALDGGGRLRSRPRTHARRAASDAWAATPPDPAGRRWADLLACPSVGSCNCWRLLEAGTATARISGIWGCGRRSRRRAGCWRPRSRTATRAGERPSSLLTG